MEKPIIFSTEMVRAILAGKKTQTRRIMSVQPPNEHFWVYISPTSKDEFVWINDNHDNTGFRNIPFPENAHLWVREAFCNTDITHCHGKSPLPLWLYRADLATDITKLFKWKPSIFMPRPASRITLKVTKLRWEMLGDITEADARAEGVNSRDEFLQLWERINGADKCDSKLWVWVVEFEVVKP